MYIHKKQFSENPILVFTLLFFQSEPVFYINQDNKHTLDEAMFLFFYFKTDIGISLVISGAENLQFRNSLEGVEGFLDIMAKFPQTGNFLVIIVRVPGN